VQADAIEVVVYRLRRKLAGTGATILTLRGLGYLIQAEPARPGGPDVPPDAP